MIGMERNSDIVKMASFAPLFEHYDMAQWSVSQVYAPAFSFSVHKLGTILTFLVLA